MFRIQWHTLTVVGWSILVTLLLAGKKRETLLLGGLLLYFTVVYSAFFAMDRYNQPLMPFLYLFIGVGMTTTVSAARRLVERLRSKLATHSH